MGYLVVIKEQNFPHHIACLFKVNERKEWYGLQPNGSDKSHFAGSGYLDTSDRTSFIEKCIKCEVDDSKLESTIKAINNEYNQK